MARIIVFLSICLFAHGCGDGIKRAVPVSALPDVFPEYADVVVPFNIAPLNFEVKNARQSYVRFLSGDTELMHIKGKESIRIPVKKWRKMLYKQKGRTLKVQVYARLKEQKEWLVYEPFEINVAEDSIDSHIVYRLIEPGYELWGGMGIYQRDLTSFDERVIVYNSLLDKGCVNCHAFHNYDAGHFMFHVRKADGGTVIVDNGAIEKINLTTSKTMGQGTYPVWHPSGNYIAFSTNITKQAFHAYQEKKIEVYDLASDLIMYDVRGKKVLVNDRFNEKAYWETFPAWSPDGKWLYMCRAEAKEMPFEYQQLKYGIYRIAFDPETGRLADSLETVYDPVKHGGSASFPRISPDGRYLLYTLAACGTFPIWHKEADLKMIDLTTGDNVDIESANSPDVESYHSWSSNGRWVIFSSRRMDGRYTRFYISWFDRQGKMHKPFLLPQENSRFYTCFLKSYNIPEFIRTRVDVSPYQIEQTIKTYPATKVSVN